jgi:hypothetical protein
MPYLVPMFYGRVGLVLNPKKGESENFRHLGPIWFAE